MRPIDDNDVQESTEITLGTGKLLGLFLGLVVICAIFFSLGYALGKSTGGPVPTQMTENPVTLPAGSTANSKPSAASELPAESADKPSTIPDQPATTPVNDPAPPPAQPAADQPPPQSSAAVVPPAAAKLVNASIPATARPLVVQVAAVSKREDAEILVKALEEKRYPAFIASGNSDALFHVQIGPFSDLQAAENSKTRLAADGYTPILKR
jgi:DedD protein